MQNSPSSHHYGCSTGQEIPRLLENQTGDDNYKTLHKKYEHNIHCINIPTKVCVLQITMHRTTLQSLLS